MSIPLSLPYKAYPSRRRGCRWIALALLAAVAPSWADCARAQTDKESQALRMTLEELGILLAGTGYYFSQHQVNSLDWTFDYSWDTVQAKLVGDAYSFDTNYFKTNTLAHAGSGTLYYIAARGNYFSPVESLAAAFFGSTAWEFFGEFRERVSINDQMVTPLGGFAFGESMTQVGRLFMRGCDSTPFHVLSAVFAPSERLHRTIDANEVPHAAVCNASGFALREDYVIHLGLGTSFSGTWSARQGRGWVLGYADAQILDVPRSQTVQDPWQGFSDGGVSQLSVRIQAATDELREVDVQARASLFGAAYRDVAARTVAVLALGAGVAYSERRYSEQPASRDPFFVLEAPALLVNWNRSFHRQRLELGLVAGGAFAQVGVFALPQYLEDHSPELLTPVAASKGYNHAFGLTLSPHLRWSSAVHELWLGARVDRVWAVQSQIGDSLVSSPVNDEELRRRLRASLAVGTDERWKFRLEADAITRRGTLGDVERKRGEFTWTTGIDGRF